MVKHPTTDSDKQSIKAAMPLYPTMDSTQSVIDLAISQLPGVPVNTIITLFMTYHNTLIKVLEERK